MDMWIAINWREGSREVTVALPGHGVPASDEHVII